MTMTPHTLYRLEGDYSGFACSERNPYQPRDTPVYWVPMLGGPVTVDIKRDGVYSPTDGDEWVYDQPTGMVMTASEVSDLIVEVW